MLFRGDHSFVPEDLTTEPASLLVRYISVLFWVTLVFDVIMLYVYICVNKPDAINNDTNRSNDSTRNIYLGHSMYINEQVTKYNM